VISHHGQMAIYNRASGTVTGACTMDKQKYKFLPKFVLFCVKLEN